MKDIHIVSVNYLMKDDVLESITSVLRDIQDCPYTVHITVVDNSKNKDGMKEELHARFPRITYIDPQRNTGFGFANNMGFKSMPARYYFALNPDTLIPHGRRTIERIITFMDNNPKIGCIGPKLINPDGTLQYSCYRFDFKSMLIKPFKQIRLEERFRFAKKHTNRLLMRDFDHNKNRPVDWVLGAAMVVRNEVVQDIGWVDPRYFMYLEDCDWCRSMWNKGWAVYYLSDIVIEHKYSRHSAKVPGIVKAMLRNKAARIHLASWLKYMWKWRGTHKYL